MSVTASRQSESPSQAVLEAVADREGIEPIDLTVPLYETIDPGALDAIVQNAPKSDESPLRIEFTYYGYTVTVSADGSVQVSDAA